MAITYLYRNNIRALLISLSQNLLPGSVWLLWIMVLSLALRNSPPSFVFLSTPNPMCKDEGPQLRNCQFALKLSLRNHYLFCKDKMLCEFKIIISSDRDTKECFSRRLLWWFLCLKILFQDWLETCLETDVKTIKLSHETKLRLILQLTLILVPKDLGRWLSFIKWK